jgi:serine protease Do
MAKELGLNADHGVVVAGVQPGSPADLAGIHTGDIILQVNRQPANSVKDVTDVIAKADDEEALLLLVKRDRGSFFVALEKKA